MKTLELDLTPISFEICEAIYDIRNHAKTAGIAIRDTGELNGLQLHNMRAVIKGLRNAAKLTAETNEVCFGVSVASLEQAIVVDKILRAVATTDTLDYVLVRTREHGYEFHISYTHGDSVKTVAEGSDIVVWNKSVRDAVYSMSTELEIPIDVVQNEVLRIHKEATGNSWKQPARHKNSIQEDDVVEAHKYLTRTERTEDDETRD